MSKISFGTDGWRAVISDDFTFDNVKTVAQAVSDYVNREKKRIRKRGSEIFGRKPAIVVGYDTRFMSEKYAELIACVAAANGIKVILADRYVPTPSVSLYIRQKNILGGVMVTASHNPAMYNGIKYKGYFGGSVGKDITGYMESRLHKAGVKFLDKDRAVKTGLLVYEDILPLHMGLARKYVKFNLLKRSGFKVLVDSMNGTGAHHIEDLLRGTNNRVTTINGDRDPYFGGRSPEPNEVHLESTGRIVKKGDFDVCLATDGDADRLAVILPDGHVISGHKVMTLLLLHMLEDRGLKGGVVQTICGTGLINRIAGKYGLPLYETPVGFKYICELFEAKDILIGGEETGGVAYKGWLPERDGIVSGLLILEMMRYRRQGLAEILKGIDKEYGEFVYKRFDLRFSAEKKKALLGRLRKNPFTSVLGLKVKDVKSYDGVKFVLEDGSWVMLRPSGTEPKLRIYSEAHSEKEAKRLIDFGKNYAMAV
ncbi:MAG: phosphoglucomutase/phosphomannomutase family protein [Candidatus Omnitrophota bacterium]